MNGDMIKLFMHSHRQVRRHINLSLFVRHS